MTIQHININQYIAFMNGRSYAQCYCQTSEIRTANPKLDLEWFGTVKVFEDDFKRYRYPDCPKGQFYSKLEVLQHKKFRKYLDFYKTYGSKYIDKIEFVPCEPTLKMREKSRVDLDLTYRTHRMFQFL
jgi:hypothetical protein